jgi:hypothetical protein
MTTTLWLLISVGFGWNGAGSTPTSVVERFITREECVRVATDLLNLYESGKPRLRCVEAKVAR